MQPTKSTRTSRRLKKGSTASVASATTPVTPVGTPEDHEATGAEHPHPSDPETPVEADLEPKVAGYRIHPIPLALPPSTEKELAALTDNVRMNGLVQPIVLYEGMILDGRNRAIACERAGVPLRTVPLQEGISPVDYVVAVNLRRRQLTAAQKAVVGAKLAPFYAAEAAERKRVLSGTRANPDGTQPEVTANLPEPDESGEAREKAAKATGASARYVSDVLKLQGEAPELFEAVASGTMGIPKALRELEKQRDERTDEETSSARNAFLAVLWNDSGASPTRAPEKSYGPKTYPHLAFFRLRQAGDCSITPSRKHGLTQVAVFAVCVEPNLMLKNTEKRSYCTPSCRFLTLSVRGDVPEVAILPNQIIENGHVGVVNMISAMFPDSMKAVSDTNDHAPDGWEHVPRKSSSEASAKDSEVASESKSPAGRSAAPSRIPSGAVGTTKAAIKPQAKVGKRQTKRKGKPTTVRDHVSKLHDGLCAITAELKRCREKCPAGLRNIASYKARRQAIPTFDALTKRLGNTVASLGIPGKNKQPGSASVGDLPFTTQIVPRGGRCKRIRRMEEIMTALAKSIHEQSPVLAQELQDVATELNRTRLSGGL